LESIIENASVWMNVIDQEDNVLVWNKAAESISGYSEAEVKGHARVWEWLYPDAEYRKQIMDSLPDPQNEMETTIKRKDGETRIICWNERGLVGSDGEISGSIVIGQDITERKQLEDRLSALHEHALKLGSAKELEEIVRHTLDAMQFTLGFTNADFWTVRDGTITVRGFRGKPFRITTLPENGRSVIAKVATDKSPIRISDTRKASIFLDDPATNSNGHIVHMLSELAVPVVVNNETVAILNVENTAVDAFTGQDQMLLEILASHVRSALSRLWQQEELKRYSGHLEELVEERTRKLAESEKKYREFFMSSPVSLWEEDFSDVKRYLDQLRRKGVDDIRTYFVDHPEEVAKCAAMVKVLDVNKATVELYGSISVEDLLSQLRRVLSEESVEEFRDELVALGEGKTRFVGEFDQHNLNVGTRHVSVILSVLPGYEETLGRVLVSVVDLTERRRIEDELRSARERLEYTIDFNPAVIYVAQPLPDLSDYYATYQSKSGVSVTGFESEEFLGEKGAEFWASRVHPDDLASYRAGTAEFWKNGHRRCEYRFLHKDGALRWIMEEANVIRDSSGNVRDIIGFWTDVTERKRMEEELQASKRRLDDIVQVNPATIYSGKPLADLSDWRLTWVSSRVVDLGGFEPHELVDHPGTWSSRIHPDDFPHYLAGMPRLFRTGHGSFEYRLLHKDGSYRWIREEVISIRDANGKPSDVVGCWTDVTELKEMEKRLTQAEHLAAVAETAAMVGHDLRNPLQGIAGATYLLRNESLTSEERDKLLQLIDESVIYSDKIVKDLLDYSRTFELKLAESTPKRIIMSALGAVKVPATIKVQENSDEHPTITVDSDRMRRVLVNLIQNAIDAMPTGGTLTISSRESDGFVEITLADTGTGMTKQITKNLWKPLLTTKAKGMGMGLAICKRFVEAHHGSISVASTPEKGTVFTIRLPIDQRRS
jgi:PAS domain S-box-containing protein